jgi:hypothetical protein
VDRPLSRIEARRRLFLPGGHAARDLGDVIGARGAGTGGAVAERLGQILEPGPGIAPQRELGGMAAADLLGDDLEMNDRDMRRRDGVTLGSDFAELAADHDQAVGGVDQLVGDARGSGEQPDIQRMRAGDAALAAHRVRDRDRLRLGESEQCRVALRQMDAAADQQQRPLGAGDQLCGAVDVGAVGADAAGRDRQGRGVDREILGDEIVRAVAHVLGHVEQDRSGRPEVATAKARRVSSGMRLVCSTQISSLTAGFKISAWRHSCVMFFQEWARLVSPAIATTGMPPFNDSTRPVTRLVAPGPKVPSQMPGRLVTRA